MTESWTVRRVLGWTTQHFERKEVDAPRLTAEILLAHTLRANRVSLYIDLDRPLEAQELERYRDLISRRTAGEPTQYLTGVREFYNRPFRVDARVLIPRPETELLVESVLRSLPLDRPVRLLDVGTGSGCIAISLAAERTLASVWASDLSNEACQLARENAETAGVGSRLTVLEGDLFSPVSAGARFDAVVANLPYVATGELGALPAEVRREPKVALDGGPDGLREISRLVASARPFLKPGGLLALEIGETQGPPVSRKLTAAGFSDVRIAQDLEKRDRFAFGTAPLEAGPRG